MPHYFELPQMRSQSLRNELARWLWKARREEIAKDDLPIINDNLRSLVALCHEQDMGSADVLFHRVSQQITKIVGKNSLMKKNINIELRVAALKPRDYLKSWRNINY